MSQYQFSSIVDWDDGEEIEVICIGDFDPGEPSVRYDSDGSGNPETPPSFTLTDVFSDYSPAHPLYAFLTDDQIDVLEEQGLEEALQDSSEEEE